MVLNLVIKGTFYILIHAHRSKNRIFKKSKKIHDFYTRQKVIFLKVSRSKSMHDKFLIYNTRAQKWCW